MFNKATSGVVTDLLFNLLLTFVCLFFLAFILVADPKEEEAGLEQDSLFLITMTWEDDVDLDIWVGLPHGKKVYYANRESGPVYLDVDVVTWKRFTDSSGMTVFVKPNQEIVSIRGGALEGKHIINAHYFGGSLSGTVATIVIHDVKRRNVVWTGTKEFTFSGQEQHFVTLDIEKLTSTYRASYSEGSPQYIVGGI